MILHSFCIREKKYPVRIKIDMTRKQANKRPRTSASTGNNKKQKIRGATIHPLKDFDITTCIFQPPEHVDHSTSIVSMRNNDDYRSPVLVQISGGGTIPKGFGVEVGECNIRDVRNEPEQLHDSKWFHFLCAAGITCKFFPDSVPSMMSVCIGSLVVTNIIRSISSTRKTTKGNVKRGKRRVRVTMTISSDQDDHAMKKVYRDLVTTMDKNWSTWHGTDEKKPSLNIMEGLCQHLVSPRKPKKDRPNESWDGLAKVSFDKDDLSSGKCRIVDTDTGVPVPLCELSGRKWHDAVFELESIYIQSSKSFGVCKKLRYLSVSPKQECV